MYLVQSPKPEEVIMEKRQNPKIKPWMWISMLVVVVLLVTNFDPIGYALEKVFGRNVDSWAINLVLVCALIYCTFFMRNSSNKKE